MPTLYPSKMFIGANLVTECNFMRIMYVFNGDNKDSILTISQLVLNTD